MWLVELALSYQREILIYLGFFVASGCSCALGTWIVSHKVTLLDAQLYEAQTRVAAAEAEIKRQAGLSQDVAGYVSRLQRDMSAMKEQIGWSDSNAKTTWIDTAPDLTKL